LHGAGEKNSIVVGFLERFLSEVTLIAHEIADAEALFMKRMFDWRDLQPGRDEAELSCFAGYLTWRMQLSARYVF